MFAAGISTDPVGGCYILAVSYSLVKGVMPMGNGRGAKALRFLVCFIITFLVLIYISPKVC